jgi:type I site-specific restriction-modification system R (restriction) subunit
MDNPTPASPAPESLIALNREVQRKFGRNLLWLQQCELLMKTLATEQEFVTSADAPQDIKAKNRELVSKKTMGQVVGDLTENYLRIGSASSKLDDDYDPPANVTLPLIRTTIHIEFSEDDFKRTEQKLADLVDLRNELVHHFLERFDLLSEDGCQAADTYLDESLRQIETNHEELRGWMNHSRSTRILMANLMNTAEFAALIMDGILPGGAGVAWEGSNRAIETAQVIEELIAMAKSFNEAARRGDDLGLTAEELAFYDALETNESSVRELGDSVLKEIARQLTDFLRKNLSVDWSVRETVRAKMRAQIKLILKRHKYPPDLEARAIDLVLKQAEALSEAWMGL